MALRFPSRRGHRAPPGTPPGTLVANPEATAPVVRAIAYGEGEFLETELPDVTAVEEYINRWPVTWVNVDGLGDVELIRQLGEVFGLHALALEDVASVHQRPKVEEYEDRLFMVLRMLEDGLPVRTEQVSLFLGEKFVLTFQEHPGDCLDPVRQRIRQGRGRVRSLGADYLAYCLVDAIIDAYYPRLDTFSDRVEALESEVLERPTPASVSKIHHAKRDLLTIRRVISPLREAIAVLLRDDHPLITATTRTYLRDCYDHAIQLLDMVESYRELVGGLLDIYLSSVSNRMNEIMKVLTIIATIFIPLGFLAGIYGMNFDPEASPWNMPELGWRWGYVGFWVLVALVGVLEIAFFWHKGWLRDSCKPRQPKQKRGKRG